MKSQIKVELSEKGSKLFKQLMKKTGLDEVEMHVHAFACFEMMIDHQINGGTVVLRNSDGTEDTIKIR